MDFEKILIEALVTLVGLAISTLLVLLQDGLTTKQEMKSKRLFLTEVKI